MAAVFTLALGIGGATAAFSAINALYIRPLELPAAGKLVSFVARDDRAGKSSYFDYRVYAGLRGNVPMLEGLAAHSSADFGIADGGLAEVVLGEYVSASYFTLTGVRPATGRFFTATDDAPGAAPTVVIGSGLWRRRFGADGRVVGRTIKVNGIVATVIGVAPDGFEGVSRAVGQDVWLPLELYPQMQTGTPAMLGNLAVVRLFGRPVAGANRQQLASAITSRIQSLPPGLTVTGKVRGVDVVDVGLLPAWGTSDGFTPVELRLITSALMLLIACINVAGMLVARATVRRREIGIRLAMGAGRSRVVRQLFTESIILFVAGGVGGVLLAAASTPLWTLTSSSASSPIRVTLDYSVDLRVLGFALGVALVTSVIFGLGPALRTTRPNIVSVLKDGVGAAPGSSRLRDVLVVAQVAASLFLLVCAGLFIRALQEASRLDPGFNATGVVVASTDLGLVGYTRERGRGFYAEIEARLRAYSEFGAVSLASTVPFGGTSAARPVQVEGHQGADGSSTAMVETSLITPDFLRALEIPVLRGRAFSGSDRQGAPLVALVSAPFAERFWPGADPVGKTIRSGAEEISVVGVVPGIQTNRLGESARMQMYLPLAQGYSKKIAIFVRTRAAEAGALAAIEREVREIAPDVPLTGVMPLRSYVSASTDTERFSAVVVGFFAAVSLVLAAVGVYGAVAYVVVRRTREIGVRVALGASGRDVLKLVLGKGVRLTVLGIGLGVVAAAMFSRMLTSRLYGVSPVDPVAFVSVALLLGAVALLASYFPARRASRLDPLAALREE
ncbi:MAG TPA: ABC transporter permease [Longimicrobium sp.]|nr:ABC transporter permease [Longimicrobium sp.]